MNCVGVLDRCIVWMYCIDVYKNVKENVTVYEHVNLFATVYG